MPKRATAIHLTPEEEATLTSWVRATTTEQRLVLRARIVLAAAAGLPTEEIAVQLRQRPATVSKWRTRFASGGVPALQDEPRPGRPRQYTPQDELRVLQQLDAKPPAGYAQWTGPLLAAALGDVSPDFVWQVLRTCGIALQQSHSWCISTAPEFAAQAADVTGLYLDPPENAIVLCVDEKPHM
jgi:transposase